MLSMGNMRLGTKRPVTHLDQVPFVICNASRSSLDLMIVRLRFWRLVVIRPKPYNRPLVSLVTDLPRTLHLNDPSRLTLYYPSSPSLTSMPIPTPQKNHYEVLNLDKDASEEAIKVAYKKLVSWQSLFLSTPHNSLHPEGAEMAPRPSSGRQGGCTAKIH